MKEGTGKIRKSRIVKKRILRSVVCLLMAAAIVLPSAVETHAEIFYLQTGRRLDTDFYANYYPDLKARYGYDAHKLLDHYINYGIFERRIPSMYYLYNMDALAIGDYVPCELLYRRASLRKNLSERQFQNAYTIAKNDICSKARAQYPNNMYGQMAVIAQNLFNYVNYAPGVKYSTTAKNYNNPCGVFGTFTRGENGAINVSRGASSAGVTRAVGLCLNILCIPYEHVNENKWKQQWARVNINGTYYVIDPFVSPTVMKETDYVRLYPPFMP